jgi:signal transduction histidine kinase
MEVSFGMSLPSVVQPTSTQERLKQLVAATPALITEVSCDGVLQRSVEVAARVIGARYAAIGIVAPDGRTLEHFMTYGIDPELAATIGTPPSGHGILGLVIREAKPIRLPDLTEHPSSSGFPAHHPSMRSFLGVPIFGNQGVFGNLYLAEKIDGDTFTADDEDIAILLAGKIAAALENARHHEQSARLLAEVQQLQRTRERFFAMVNHELRNSLAAVYGWSEMLIRKRDPATVPRAAFEVMDAAQEAIALINDLLDLSRLDEDRLKPLIKAVDPIAIANRAIRRVTPAAELRNVTLQLVSASRLPNGETDASRVEQILINLLGNAIRYAPKGSVVRVGVEVNGRRIVYRVEDEGPGVPAGDVERIFDIYVTKPDEETRGLGLGLPLSRRLARLLGGELHAVSRPGRGGCFVLEVLAAMEK